MLNNYVFLTAAVICYLIFQWIFGKFFYNGRLDDENWMVYNLSYFGEFILIAIFLAFTGVSLYQAFFLESVWYIRIFEWLFDFSWMLAFFPKIAVVFKNRNNQISINENRLKYKIGNEEGILNISRYKFSDNTLEVLDASNEEKISKTFNLQSSGLLGFKPKMQLYMKENVKKKSKANERMK